VHKFCTLAASAGAKVISFHNSYFQTSSCGVKRYSRAGSAAADNEKVVFIIVARRTPFEVFNLL
jgi:hypothetical protein